MNLSKLSLALLLMCAGLTATAQRSKETLRSGWKFSRVDDEQAISPSYNDRKWQSVTVPHDWAIYGPFSIGNDKQNLAITQDGQTDALMHAGRTGGLPFVGAGWYRRSLSLPSDLKGKKVLLTFDGAMSHARVYVNGSEVGYWPYGYNTFVLDITKQVRPGTDNVLAVRLDNKHESSRWYPGAGLYRNVHLEVLPETHFVKWSTQIQTPRVSDRRAEVSVRTHIKLGYQDKDLKVRPSLIGVDGKAIAIRPVSTLRDEESAKDEAVYDVRFNIDNPKRWDIKQPNLYKLVLDILDGDRVIDTDTTSFGVRTIELKQHDGFYLNGRKIKFKGVCLHHDQGPLGGVVNEASYRRQIRIMQDMGVNAIRTSHNMPAPEFVRICDEMGMMLMAESFDSWYTPKVPNGYNLDFAEWYERDLVNLVRQFRNNPSVVMWCIGNEVEEQRHDNGAKMAYTLQQICHREDPTRPVTNGMDNPLAVLKNGMAATMDIPGFNYRPFLFDTAHRTLPQGFVLGSETASTVSSRGVYKFPVVRKSMAKYDDHQSSSYDVEHCSWSNLPEDDWMIHEDNSWAMGEFIWTGFDYIGEPTPYYTDWPSHSSLFGAVDLAGIPKDRFWLYRSYWNTEEKTLHVLPHWTWPGREGEVTPVFVYTSYPEAELFINGKSQGRVKKDTSIGIAETNNDAARRDFVRQKRYRLMWMNTKYEPGTIKVVAYDQEGKPAETKEVHTAGTPDRFVLSVDRERIQADGRDIAFVRVSLVDKNGNLIPSDARLVNFSVKGAGRFRAAASGNPASLDLFHVPYHHLFSGELTALVEAGQKAGTIEFTASAKGVKSASIKIEVQ